MDRTKVSGTFDVGSIPAGAMMDVPSTLYIVQNPRGVAAGVSEKGPMKGRAFFRLSLTLPPISLE